MSYGSTSSPARPLRRAESMSDDDDEDTLNPPVKYDGHATVRSSVTNLANTVIGAGALAFPSAFAAMGLIPGIISCLASGSLTCFGLYLLSRCATQVGKRPGDEGRKASFNEVARLAFGKKWIMRLFDFAIAVKCFGVSTSYLIICKTLLPKVSETLADAVHHPLPADSILLSQDFWLVAVMFIIVPLSFLRTLDSLRFASQVALGTVAYLILVVVGWYIFKGPSPNRGAIELGRFKRNTLSAFPIQVFAFTCSQNLFPIYNELKNKTQARMNSVIGISIGMAAASYEILGIIGYLTFGNKVTSNIIAMYPASSLIIAVGRLGIVLLVGLSYPLQVLPCRVCVNTLTRGIVKTPRAELPTDPDASVSQQDPDVSMSQENTDEEELNLLPKYGHDGKEIKRIGEIRQWKFYIITVGILTCGFLVALSVDELEVVLGFVGATGSTILSFILPGFFYFKLFRKESGSVKWAALALGIYGLAVMTFCLTFNIINLERRKAPLGH